MKLTHVAVALGLSIPWVASCGSDATSQPRDAAIETTTDGDAGEAGLPAALCDDGCAVIAGIDCPTKPDRSGCLEACMNWAAPCRSEGEAFIECVIASDGLAYVCNPETMTLEPRSGTCDQERDALGACLIANPETASVAAALLM